MGALAAGAAAGPGAALAAGAIGAGALALKGSGGSGGTRGAFGRPARTGTGGAAGGTAYPPVPSLVEPAIWAAGTPAARRTGPASGQPQGLNWATANQMQAWMPGLIAR
jgi:hypothetical protein